MSLNDNERLEKKLTARLKLAVPKKKKHYIVLWARKSWQNDQKKKQNVGKQRGKQTSKNL
jgi:hypothetical protein